MLYQLLKAACIPGLMASFQTPRLLSQPLLLPLLLTRMLVITRSPFWTIQDCPFVSELLTPTHLQSALCHKSAHIHRLWGLGCRHLAVTKTVLRQEKEPLGRESKHHDEEARRAQKLEGKVAAAGGRKPTSRISPQTKTRFASPPSTVPLLGA